MKIIKIVLISLLSLIVAVALVWCIAYYLVWPKPGILSLIPGEPLVYITASNLSETLPAAKESEFVERVAKSPLWKDIKSSGLWRRIAGQKTAWEEQTKARLSPAGILRLVEKDALLALYEEQGRWGFLLLSEVGLLTRMNILSDGTEEMMKSLHEFSKEKYRGVKLMTVKGSNWEFSYGFVGRVGILSLDKSLLKKAVDARKDKDQGLAAMSGFKELFADPPGSPDVSLYVNAAKIRDTFDLSAITPLIDAVKANPRAGHLVSVAQETGTLTGVGLSKNGNLRFDIRMSRVDAEPVSSKRDDNSARTDGWVDGLAVPDDCLIFALHETLGPQFLSDILGVFVDLDRDVIGDRLLPALHSGMAVAVLKPKAEDLQLLPLLTVLFRVKDRAMAESALKALEGSMKTKSGQLIFNETEYKNIPIRYARVPMLMAMSLDAGYTLIGDDLLVVATDTSALEMAIDVFSGERQSLMKDENYASVLSPIVKASDGQIFVNIGSATPVIKQAAMLYALRAKFMGEASAAKIATALQQNVSILEAWRYIGTTFDSSGDRMDVKLVLSGR